MQSTDAQNVHTAACSMQNRAHSTPTGSVGDSTTHTTLNPFKPLQFQILKPETSKPSSLKLPKSTLYMYYVLYTSTKSLNPNALLIQ